MTSKEVEILLKTVYKGEGANKALADLDKISASGSKLSGVMGKVNKALGGDVFGGASESFRKRNPQLFQVNQGTAILQSDKFLRMVANKSLGMGALFPPYKGPPPPIIGSQAGAAGAGGNGYNGIFQKFTSRLFSKALSVTAGLLIYKAINIPLQALTKTIKGLNDAIEHARKLYASALGSGLGLQFTAKRNLLAEVLGVSEKDVFQYGAAIGFLNSRLEASTAILAKAAPNLASVSYGFKILEIDIRALFATLVNDSAPAIRKFTDGLSNLVKMLIDHAKTIEGIVGFIIRSQIPLDLFVKGVSSNGKDSGPAPDPVAYMKQVHASALEHMGLIVGGIGGATDFAAQTAQNTKKTAEAVQKIAQKMSNSGSRGSFYDPLMSVP